MKRFCLEVSGDFACFTRPEMKVERVSYDVMTPSAARAVFEAILWKPAVRWHVRQIEVLSPIRWINLRRNEVAGVLSVSNVKEAMNAAERNEFKPLALWVEEERQQRAGLFLRDVRYRLHADLEFIPQADPGSNEMKYQEMFTRRAEKGQCFHQPYLGCREFAARVELVQDPTTPAINHWPDEMRNQATRDLGWMLHDLDFAQPDNPRPRFFHAKMQDGVVAVPAWDSPEVRG